MEYSKLKKTPFPPADEAVKEKDRNINYYRTYGKPTAKLYRAEKINGVLAVTLYGRETPTNEVTALYRHFYDDKTYATTDLITGKKLCGMLDAYTSFYNTPEPVSKKDADAIEKYFKGRVHGADIRTIIYFERDIKKAKNLLSYKKECDRWRERNAVVQELPSKVTEWIKSEVLKPYKFYYYNKDEKTGFCSDCKKSFFVDTGHNKPLVCPKCGAMLTAVSLKKRKYNNIRFYENVIYLDKIREKNGMAAIVLRAFEVVYHHQNLHNRSRKFETCTYIHEKCRRFYALDFIPQKNGDEFEYCYTTYKQDISLEWRSARKVPMGCPVKDSYIYPGNAEILKDALSAEKQNVDIAAIIRAIKCRPAEVVKAAEIYPSLENFAKLGYSLLCYGIYDYSNYSWRYGGLAKKLQTMSEPSPSKLLNLSKEELQKMKKASLDLNDYLRYLNLNEIRTLNIEEFIELKKRNIDGRYSELKEIMKARPMSYSKLMRYLDNQSQPRSTDRKDILITFRDYLDMLKKMKLPVTDVSVFPQHLVKEHDALNAIYIDGANSKQNKKLMKRTKILDMLTYDNGTYLIRPLYKASEFVRESTVLSHCVKTYIDRCAKGETNIYGIRKSSDPDTPYFTLTLDNTGKVVTNLGKKNCNPPKEVTAFVREWERKIISVKLNDFLKAIAGKDEERCRITA